MFGGKRRDRSAAKAAEAQREAEQQILLAALADRPDTVCPFLGTDESRADFSPQPMEAHRCYAFGEAAPLSSEQQGRVCLQRGYGNCPRYLRGLLVIPTDEMEAIRRRKAEATVKRQAPPAPAVAPAVAPAPPPPPAPEPRPIAYEETLLTLPAPESREEPAAVAPSVEAAQEAPAGFASDGVDPLEELANRQAEEAAEHARVAAAAEAAARAEEEAERGRVAAGAEAAARAEVAAENARVAAAAEAAAKAERAAESARLAAAAQAAAKAEESARVAQAATAAKAEEAARAEKAERAAAEAAAKAEKAAARDAAKAAKRARPAKAPRVSREQRPPRSRRQPRERVAGPARMRLLVAPPAGPQRMLVGLEPGQPIANRPTRLATMAAAAVVLALALVAGGGIVAYGQLRSNALAAGPVATESPTPTATPAPTPEPTPRPTPRPTRSPRPTPSPSPTPEPTSPPSPEPAATQNPAARTWTYVIRDYDTISLIAQRYGTTTETLMDLNPRYRNNPNLVVEGDLVIVPCTAIAISEGRCP